MFQIVNFVHKIARKSGTKIWTFISWHCWVRGTWVQQVLHSPPSKLRISFFRDLIPHEIPLRVVDKSVGFTTGFPVCDTIPTPARLTSTCVRGGVVSVSQSWPPVIETWWLVSMDDDGMSSSAPLYPAPPWQHRATAQQTRQPTETDLWTMKSVAVMSGNPPGWFLRSLLWW